jgi:hypothetical protein
MIPVMKEMLLMFWLAVTGMIGHFDVPPNL